MTLLKCEWEAKHVDLTRIYTEAIALWNDEKSSLRTEIDKLNEGVGRYKNLFNKKSNEMEELQREYKTTVMELAKVGKAKNEVNGTLLALQRELVNTQKLL
jgi:uncharacterized coiled-coil DUF342 family protein